SSPQFLDGVWTYSWREDGHGLRAEEGTNPFVEATLQFALIYAARSTPAGASRLLGKTISITILADNDFYSQLHHLKAAGTTPSKAALMELPPYNHTGSAIGRVAKTGLGSSAAMVTSLTFAILLHFGLVVSDASGCIQGTDTVHKLAQAAHCVAQGKIGSGFDVASAIYGSHAYTRFSPSLLDGVIHEPHDRAAAIMELVKAPWDHAIKEFSLPPGLHLQLGDISTGSNTPKMVSKLLEWRKNNFEQCEQIWLQLAGLNDSVREQLNALAAMHATDREGYTRGLSSAAALPIVAVVASSDPVHRALASVHQTFQQIRHLMKRMGQLAGVSIEPDEQSELLDVCLAEPGVLLAGVPGGNRRAV
ncbi:phosphomevalonate kinase, partial [Kappamyces sp. JEL0680]